MIDSSDWKTDKPAHALFVFLNNLDFAACSPYFFRPSFKSKYTVGFISVQELFHSSKKLKYK